MNEVLPLLVEWFEKRTLTKWWLDTWNHVCQIACILFYKKKIYNLRQAAGDGKSGLFAFKKMYSKDEIYIKKVNRNAYLFLT